MGPPSLVSPEVVRRIRDEQTGVLRSLEAARQLSLSSPDPDIEAHLEALRSAFEDHARRVDGLLEAIGQSPVGFG